VTEVALNAQVLQLQTELARARDVATTSARRAHELKLQHERAPETPTTTTTTTSAAKRAAGGASPELLLELETVAVRAVEAGNEYKYVHCMTKFFTILMLFVIFV
jgi:hypothetical protein